MTLQQATHNPKLSNATRPQIWAERLLIAVLAVLLVGPLIAPLFQATRLPVIASAGTLARDLLTYYVCPTPAKSYALFGFPMAVCARCWGATIGLWAAWLVCRPQVAGHSRTRAENHPSTSAWFVERPWELRLCFALAALLLWNLEINSWPTAPLAVRIVNGANGGFWVAMFAGSLWHTMRSTTTRRVDIAES
ncbi:MAG TPA: DUF2085 domain-containing protein [Roseiflexaceae bacterium]|nr:DUF2085 domain-containing protein [Roseiflexaceae bacterium]